MEHKILLPKLRYQIGEEPIDHAKGEGKNEKPTFSINKVSYPKYIEKVELNVGRRVWERICKSFLGPMIRFEKRKIKMSARLVHFILTRQIITTKKNELWFHFSGKPMRFSIREFQMVTGLKCDGKEAIDKEKIKKEEIKWPALEKDSGVKLEDIQKQLMDIDPGDEENKYALGMLLILQSAFLVKSDKAIIPKEDIKFAKDVSRLENYPWGKRAFKSLVSSLVFNLEESNLLKKKYLIYGYPQAFELWILQSIPVLMEEYGTVDKDCGGFLCERFKNIGNITIEKLIDLEGKHVS